MEGWVDASVIARDPDQGRGGVNGKEGGRVCDWR